MFSMSPSQPSSGWASVIASNTAPMFRPTVRPFVAVPAVVTVVTPATPAPVTEPKAEATAGKPGGVSMVDYDG